MRADGAARAHLTGPVSGVGEGASGAPMTPAPPLDDFAARSVWADLLAEQGDPRGELAQLQLAREERLDDVRLARAEALVLARHGRALLGPLRHATSLLELSWRRGSVVQATVRSAAQQQWAASFGAPVTEVKPPPLARRVRELLSLPVADGLAALTVALPRSPFAQRVLLECVGVVAQVAPAALTSLAVLELEARYDDWDLLGWFPPESLSQQVGALAVSAAPSLMPGVVRLLG